MQSYTEIAGTTTVKDSRTQLLNNDKTIMSCSSGAAFPTTNLQQGMLCYRTDNSTLYVLSAVTPSAVWTIVGQVQSVAGKTGAVTLTKADVGLSLADNSADADKSVYAARTLRNAGSASGQPMAFNWAGQGGQATWMWGGNDGVNMYVYNPANFSVNYANSAGSTGNLNGITGWRYQDLGINPAYVWCTHGSATDNFLTATGNLSVNYANSTWNSNLLQGQAGGYWINNGSSAVVNIRNSGAAALVAGISGYGDVSWSVYGSDERLKENIEPTQEDSLAKIRQFDFKRFNYRVLESGFCLDDGRLHKLGPIAQQLQAIDSEWVQDESTWLQPDTYPMLMAAMHAIQQQAETIDALTARIAALEAQ